MLQALLAQPLETVRPVDAGAGHLGRLAAAPETEREFTRRVPSASIRQGYGLTESAALVSSSPAGRARSGSVGLPVPGCEVEIRDRDGRALPAGEAGEICVRSPGLMLGYWNAPETTARAVRDGWLHTGDVGRLDEDGYLYIVDRIKDLIIRGGFNVYPRDVEDALVEHPDVAMAGVIGAPSASHGEEVVAFVCLRAGATLEPEQLIDWSRDADRWLQIPAPDRTRRRDPADPGRQGRSQGAAGVADAVLTEQPPRRQELRKLAGRNADPDRFDRVPRKRRGAARASARRRDHASIGGDADGEFDVIVPLMRRIDAAMMDRHRPRLIQQYRGRAGGRRPPRGRRTGDPGQQRARRRHRQRRRRRRGGGAAPAGADSPLSRQPGPRCRRGDSGNRPEPR